MTSIPEVQKVTGEQVRAARALLRWEQRDLADRASISVQTVKRLEGIHGEISAQAATMKALVGAFVVAGVEFIDPDNGGSGVRLKS